jgi:hypothetical protein
MKKLIERKLPFGKKYVFVSQKYIPIISGNGCFCANCGRIIANIATIKCQLNHFTVGIDCLETLLLSNEIDNLATKDIEFIENNSKLFKKAYKSIKENIQNEGTSEFEIERVFGGISVTPTIHGECILFCGDTFEILNMSIKNFGECIEQMFPKLILSYVE